MCRFKFVWRTYQKRVLDELYGHMEDDSLHVVAAPGSGKTVLGIETIIKLGKPALVLSPTLTIRDQWIDRFADLFLKDPEEVQKLVSKNLAEPKPLTSETYQSLHSFIKENKTRNIPENYFETLVLDEAHHLRTSWWKSLLNFKEKMKKCRIIALTATPPYDVTYFEWERYTRLCGPIDSEISVPELVKNGDLCAHQDYIYLSKPDQSQLKKLLDYKEKIRELTDRILNDQNFAKHAASHPWIADFERNMSESLGQPRYLTSMLVYLEKHKSTSTSKSLNLDNAVKILTGGKGGLPGFNLKWFEIFLNFVFYEDKTNHFSKYEAVLELKKELERLGVIEKKKIFLSNNPKIKKMLVKNPSKLSSIADIVQMEYRGLENKLRMVILTDFICLSYLPRTQDDKPSLVKIGVVPIFETLRRVGEIGLKTGVLCGKLVLFPGVASPAVIHFLEKEGVEDARSKIRPAAFDERFVELKLEGKTKELSVKAMTKIFKEGHINVIVGTQSLLGEGWDAPCINTIVLASYVGSYMLSNQMRGRAIRINPENPGKTANIWHLACLDPTSEDFGEDFTTLERRFLSFTGVAMDKPLIRNGIKRMALDDFDLKNRGYELYNGFCLKKALERDSLENRWKEALESGTSLEEGLSLKKDWRKVAGLKSIILSETIRALFFQGVGFGIFFFLLIIRDFLYSRHISPPFCFGVVLFGIVVSALFSSYYFVKAFVLFIKHGSLEKNMCQVGKCVLETLRGEGFVKTPFSKIQISAQEEFGEVVLTMKGATLYEKTLFFNCMEEIFGVVKNPRYLLVRRSDFTGLLSFLSKRFKKTDFHNVPEIFGKNKTLAKKYAKNWSKRIGKAFVFYTRNERGRMLLLKAREYAPSSDKTPESRRVNRWV
ncbi:DEAD/DEAH box helicase family protein [candidate division WOR-3 bacterium]|nr:DEAD/DEAH box helicase family protein [candidate division WOR-3 bacterium]